MHDAIVVGARCAGASTAMLLARAGLRVLLVDRARFPSDIPHGHLIHRGGPQRLARWGLLDQVLATGAPPLHRYTSDYGDYKLAATDLAGDGVCFACAPRRSALDAVLVQAAVDAGAELRQGFVVEGFAREGDRIAGVRGRTITGVGPVTELATITIGADGRNSRLAREVGAAAYETTPPLSFWYWSYWSGVPNDGLEVRFLGDRGIFAFPTNDGLFGVMVEWPAAEFSRVRGDIERGFGAVVDRAPALAEALRTGRREERFYGATDLPNFLRQPWGPGWALVGDAGCHKDPFMALGICDAFRDADLLACAVLDGMAGRHSMEEALADYHQRRDDATRADYGRNIQFARGEPPADFMALRAAVRGDAAAMRRLCLVGEDLLPREALFGTGRLQTPLAAAD